MRPLGRCGRRRRKNKAHLRITSLANDESFIHLQKWMRKIDHRKDLQLCYFPDTGRGMRAMKKFKPGECIVSIPQQLLITVDTVLNSFIGDSINRYCTAFTPQQLLTLFLAVESVKGKSSYWSVYISSLPKEYSTLIYFSTSELNLLKPRTKEKAETLRERFNTACQEILSFVFEFLPSFRNIVSEDVLKWAWSTVDTRSVFLETKPHACVNRRPEESNVALAPLLDMLNHNDTAQITAGLNPASGCYEIVTEDKYDKYDQVFISYGPHDNTKLLINYGFTLPQNINNSFIFTMDDIKICFPQLQNWDKKLSLIKECDLHKGLVCTMEGPSWSLMTTLKIVALTWEHMSLWKRLVQGGSVSEDNDSNCQLMAQALIRSALGKAKQLLKTVKNHPSTLHKNLIENLAADDVNILELSLKHLLCSRD